MMRLLRSVLACLRNFGQRHCKAVGVPRLNWRGTPVVQGYPTTPAGSLFDTLISTRLRPAGQRPGHSEQSKA
jgi:hypothetical protein